MVVLILENAPPRLRGRLSTLLLEVRAGVYIGKLSLRLRHQLWALVEKHLESGSAVMAWSDPLNLAGVDFLTLGENRRESFDLDGVRLVNFVPLVCGLQRDPYLLGNDVVDFLSGDFFNKNKEIE